MPILSTWQASSMLDEGLHGHFGSEYLLQVIKNDLKKRCFLKKFGFSKLGNINMVKPKTG